MTGAEEQPVDERKRAVSGITIAVIAVLAAVAGAVVIWLLARDADPPTTPSPSPSVMPSETPSPTPTPTPTASDSPTPLPSPVEPTFVDVDGGWCHVPPNEFDEPCLLVELPMVTTEGFEDNPSYVFTSALAGPPTIPDMSDFDVDPEPGGCWVGSSDSLGGESGSAFIYCPAGAEPGGDADWVLAWDDSVDRLYTSQGDPGAPPLLRAD